jgi:hypothetical protein
MNLLSIQAVLSPDELAQILAAGKLPADKGQETGQAIARVGAQFIWAVIQRNTPDHRATLQQLHRASDAFARGIKALGLPPSLTETGSQPSAAVTLLDPYPQIRIALNLAALRDRQRGSSAPVEMAAVVEELERLLEGVVRLQALIDQAARQRDFELARPKRQSEALIGLARAVMGRLPTNAISRADNALESFLRSLWEIYVQASGRLPGTSVGKPCSPTAGKAGGPFIRFCRASLDWILEQMPAELSASDPKLRKARSLTDNAIRDRLQRAVDFGTMRRH